MPDPSGQDQIWTSPRRQLLEWFQREAPSLAQPYEAAVQLIHMPKMPARVHLVCHLVRDIYSKLPEILDGEYRRMNAGEVYRSFVDKIEAHWSTSTRSFLTTDGAAETDHMAAAKVSVSAAAARSVDDLLEKHRALKEQQRSTQVLARALYRRFKESGLQPPPRLVEAFEKQRRWFVDRAHLVTRKDKVPSPDGLVDHFKAFERTLCSLVGQYFTGKQEIDVILHQANR